MDTQLTTKRILIFLAIAFGVPWMVDLAIYLTGLIKDDPLKWMTIANYVAISTPALANVATRLITREGWGNLRLRPNFRRGWRFYLAAWLLPLLAVALGGGIFYLLFPQSFDPNLGEVRKLFASVPSIASTPWIGFLSITLQTVLIVAIINGIASIGEEFGWRAYLLPKLVERFSGEASGSASSARKAALLIGVVWSVWHWPLFYLGTFAGAPFPNLLAYLVFTCSLSVFLAWVTLRSGSVWTASLGHGMVNGTSPLPMYLLKGPASELLGPGPTGLIGGLGYIVLALVLLVNRKAFAGQKEAAPEKAPAAAGGISI